MTTKIAPLLTTDDLIALPGFRCVLGKVFGA
ncbi:MAG: hypothetical protein QOJ76_2368 [Acidobacteriota bacterium]|nr:hypothetical protein [Acidobacteriota bacterium]